MSEHVTSSVSECEVSNTISDDQFSAGRKLFLTIIN